MKSGVDDSKIRGLEEEELNPSLNVKVFQCYVVKYIVNIILIFYKPNSNILTHYIITY